jgi:glucose/arabinose dehydrogenase/mono/diheme cytochrome c family protein
MLTCACTTPNSTLSEWSNPAPVFDPTPSPAYLSPEESMKTMYLPAGYHMELVASEPMIRQPVAIAWDGDARMFVAEMITYMQDADATGEQQSRSRISLLEDSDHDGRMDKSTVYIDSLLLPRMIQCVGHELLVNETNSINIYSYKDNNGDGKADEKKLVYRNDQYNVNDANMEHQRSGLDWNIDNWMYITYDRVRFRYTDGVMETDTIPSGAGGQWGLTHDNYGRLFYSSAGGETPALGFQINPIYGRLDFDDQLDPQFQEVWPVIATPDVQGGLQRLRPDVTLNHFTASCGQSIFRGDRLPADLVGDYLVCEPVGRIIRRAKVTNVKGKIVLHNAYEKQEFISSSDMNFRPVNTATGPDGNLYIVDMHRGIIQQGNWTRPGTFLRQRIDSLGLAKNIGHGRIYRVVHDEFNPGPKPHMLEQSSSQLVSYLDHPNGWWRDNAQKQIIINGDKSVVPALRRMAMGEQSFFEKLLFWNDKPGPLGRIHALWTLEGLNAIDKEVLIAALKDESAQVRRTAVWISQPYFEKNDEEIISQAATLKQDPDHDVLTQLLLSLYNSKSDNAQAIVKELVAAGSGNEILAAAKGALDKNESVKTFGLRLGNLEAGDRNLILSGKEIFKSLCATCHGPDGKGIAIGGASMAAPPLAGSKRLDDSDQRVAVRILLKGLSGPVDTKTYPSVMPSMEANSDEWIASVASYIRYEFGNGRRRRGVSPAISPEEVKRIRQEERGRKRPWTLRELGG